MKKITFIISIIVTSFASIGFSQTPYVVKDINPGSLGNVRNISNINGTLFFGAWDGSDLELWKSDGTESGTVLVKNINSSESSFPNNFAAIGNIAYFVAQDAIHGQELWKSDGTEAGTVMVKDINTSGFSLQIGLTVLGSTLYFVVDDGIHGQELWKSDGTETGTIMVKDINTSGSSLPNNLTVLGSEVYFNAYDGINGSELWKSDGTDAGTVLVKDINTSGNANINSLTVFENELYFVAYDDINGSELWKSDGTEAGTVMVKDINTSGNGSPQYLTVVGSELYFSADDGINGRELWKSDGTASGTVMVKDINISGHSYPSELTVLGSEVYFVVRDGINGYELWKSDGTASGTVMVKDFNVSIFDFISKLTVLGSELYFVATDGINGYELWKTDGTTSGTVMIDINPSGNSYPEYLTVIGSTLYFKANNGINGNELMALDVSVSTSNYDLTIGQINASGSTNDELGDQIHLTSSKVAALGQLSSDFRHIAAGANFLNLGTSMIPLSLNPRIEMIIEKKVASVWQQVYMETIPSTAVIPANGGISVTTNAIANTSWMELGEFRTTYTATFDGVEDGDTTNNFITHTFQLTEDQIISNVPLDASNNPIATTTDFNPSSVLSAYEVGIGFYLDNATAQNVMLNGVNFLYKLPLGYTGPASQALFVNLYQFDASSGQLLDGNMVLTRLGVAVGYLSGLGTTIPEDVLQIVSVSGFVNASTGVTLAPLEDGHYFISIQIQPSLFGGVSTFGDKEVPHIGLNTSNNFYLNHRFNEANKVVQTSFSKTTNHSGIVEFQTEGLGFDKIPAISLELSSNFLSTNELEATSGILLYPNPTKADVFIDNKELKELHVEVYDLNGRKLLTQKTREQKHSIDISSFVSGIYIFKVTTINGMFVHRIIKK